MKFTDLLLTPKEVQFIMISDVFLDGCCCRCSNNKSVLNMCVETEIRRLL